MNRKASAKRPKALFLGAEGLADGNFADWLSLNAAIVKVAKSADVPAIARQTQRFIKTFRPKVKECYRNAFYCADGIQGVKVVHGYASLRTSDLVVPHAWNVTSDGIHFDVTAEAHGLRYGAYKRVIILTSSECWRYVSQCRSHDHYVLPYFLNIAKNG